MKKIFLLICFIIWIQFLGKSHAKSGGVGNGGDALVCPGAPITLLDSYETKKLGLTIDLENGSVQATLRSMVSVAVRRLSVKDKYTAKQLYKYAMEMVQDFEYFQAFPNALGINKGKSVFLSPDVVGEIQDSNHRTLPSKDCVLKQMVSQINPERSLENRYEINSSLWNALSLEDKAMTILHEAWYRILIEDGARDSVGARYMNGLIASSEFESFDFARYLKDLRSTEKKFYIVENNSSLVFDSKFIVDLKHLKLSFDGKRVCTPSLKVRANIKKLAWFTQWHMGLAKINFTNVCFKNSTLESLTLPNDMANSRINLVMENYLLRLNGLKDKKGILKFNKNGKFKQAHGMHYESLFKMFYKCHVKGKKVKTFSKLDNCKGPYLHHKSEIENPAKVIFDLNEAPVGFSFPVKL